MLSYLLALYQFGGGDLDKLTGKSQAWEKPTKKGFDAALEEIKKALPEDCISQDPSDLETHTLTWWTYHEAGALPGAILYPRSTSDVVAIVKACNKHRIPIVPYAGGTSLEGHCFAPMIPGKQGTGEGSKDLQPGFSFTVDLSVNMNNIVQLHERDLNVVVQPGLPYEELNDTIKERGVPLFFPVDPGPGACIGGMIGCGSSGTNAVHYGTMRERVLNLTVVLPDGEVIKTRSRANKSSAGPDLTKLFVGSEGTLGIIVEATLRLAPILPTSVGMASFPDIEAAADTVRDVVQRGIALQCVELLDEVMVKAVNQSSGGERKLDERPSLFFKLQGTDDRLRKELAEIVKSNNGSRLVFAKSEKEKEEIWSARKVALMSALSYVPGSRCWTTDVCVPISNFPELVRKCQAHYASKGIIGPIVGHAGDGNFHAMLLFRDREEYEKVREAVHYTVELALSLDGTCTGEHGVGLGKMEYLDAELGPGTVSLLKSIKRLVDPKSIMNPGKLVDTR